MKFAGILTVFIFWYSICYSQPFVRKVDYSITKQVADFKSSPYESAFGYSDMNNYLLPNATRGLKQSASQSNAIYGAIATVGYGKLRYTFDNEDIIQFGYSITKSGGLSIEFPLEVMDGKLSFYNELTFSQFEAKATNTIIDSSQAGVYVTFDSKYNFSPNILGLTHFIRYNLTPNDFKYYIGIGVYNNFVFGGTNTKETKFSTQSGQSFLYDKAVPDPATHGIMLLASTGFSYRNIGFEIRYDPGRNYTNMFENYVFQQLFSAHFHVRINPN